ncbi:hypothetical protein ACVWYN_003394 [Pedobacter sp. UYP24]
MIEVSFRYTNDAEPIADGYRTDNRRTKPGRSQVLPKPKPDNNPKLNLAMTI